VRLPLREPIFVRPAFDARRSVYRHNIT
jgi:hypothetical protein